MKRAIAWFASNPVAANLLMGVTILAGLVALGLGLSSLAQAQAARSGDEPQDQKVRRQSLQRVQLEEQLIRSDATAVMLGEWLSLRESQEPGQ